MVTIGQMRDKDAALGRKVWFGFTTWNMYRASTEWYDDPTDPKNIADVTMAGGLWSSSAIALFVPDPEMTALGWASRNIPKLAFRVGVFTAKVGYKVVLKPAVTFAIRRLVQTSPLAWAIAGSAAQHQMASEHGTGIRGSPGSVAPSYHLEGPIAEGLQEDQVYEHMFWPLFSYSITR